MKFNTANTSGVINSRVILTYAEGHAQYQAALKLVTKAFDKHRRDFTGLKYSSHAMTVACLLLDVAKLPEPIMVASALEDVLAMGVMTEADIQVKFGDEVLGYVQALTAKREDGLVKEPLRYGQRIKDAGADLQTVKLASLLDHLCAAPAGKLRKTGGRIVEAQHLMPFLSEGDAELQRRVNQIMVRLLA